MISVGGTAMVDDGRERASGAAVVCTDVTRSFDGTAKVLDGVDLECRPGEIVVLLGPSGCGKTTLLRSIAGLDTPTGGSILVGGAPTTHRGRARRDVAMVFQNFALYPSKNVFQNIEFPLRMNRVPRREREERVRKVARMLQIEHLLRRSIRQLSGGQRQRVAIGRALVREPALLLLDEPLSSLDAELRVTMRAELRELQRRVGATMVFVTHDQAEALALADQLVVLNRGRVEQAAPVEAVYGRPATTFVASFLGAMNLLAGEPVAEGFRLDRGDTGHHEMLDVAAAAVPSAARVIGVRPEDLRPGRGAAGEFTVTGRTELVELLGRERLVHFVSAGRRLRARVHVDVAVGETFTAHALAADLHYFDAEGRRIDVDL